LDATAGARGRSGSVRTSAAWLGWGALLLGIGCSPELAPPRARAAPVLAFVPSASAEEVTPVVRLELGTWTDPATLRLFHDELSDYHVGRVRDGELPGTLLEREVPSLAFAGSSGATSAPLEVLTAGIYSLASAELGLVGVFAVATSTAPPVLGRRWPPPGLAGGVAIYCGDQAPGEGGEVLLEPASSPARFSPGITSQALFSESCLRLDVTEPLAEGAVALPPPEFGGVLLEPLPLYGGEPTLVSGPPCSASEFALGPACVAVADDRLTLRSNQPLLIVFEQPAPALVELRAGASEVVRGLLPESEIWLAGEVLDAAGRSTAFAQRVTTAAAEPRLVLSEVLANAAGPEPGQEWIELVNGGAAALDLAGYTLEDGGGSATLPARLLAPGAYVVLVSEQYVPDPALDLTAADPAQLVVLPSLGKSGLSNSGELLRLFDPSGQLVSSFPALKAAAAGKSLARRAPESPDDDPEGFGLHAAPGASPGAPNVLEQ
jgi:hypothetical protein